MRRLILVLLGLGAAGCPPPDCVYGEQHDPLTGACFLRCPDAALRKEEVPLKDSAAALRGVYGVRQGRGESLTVYVVGDKAVLRYRDGAWQDIGDPNWQVNWNGVWAAGPDDVWAVGTGGNLLHAGRLSVPLGNRNLLSISGSAAERILLGAEGWWALSKNGGWAREDKWWALYWGVAVHAEEVWLMGVLWNQMAFVQNLNRHYWEGSDLNGLRTARGLFREGDAAWIVGEGQAPVLRLDGTTWVKESTPAGLQRAYGISGRGARDLWVVGEKGTILRGDAGARPEDRWTQVRSPAGDTDLHAVWVDKQDCGVWIVGDRGTVLRRP